MGQLMVRGMGAGLEDLVSQTNRLRLDCTGPREPQKVLCVKQCFGRQCWQQLLGAFDPEVCRLLKRAWWER